MSKEQRQCPKCGREMKGGFLLDLWGMTIVGELGKRVEWVEGEAELVPWTNTLNLLGKERRKVETYCCVGCGYLESYAADGK
jgi:hypothetical protein